MFVDTISQPETQFGNELENELQSSEAHERIVFVSAFVSLRTILRMREQLLNKLAHGTNLTMTVGIDLGGTSKEVLEELLRWNCEALVFHNPLPRATFHPKFYFFRTAANASLFVGSNNLTDGGLYTNYEVTTKHLFDLPADTADLDRVLSPLLRLFDPENRAIRKLDKELINALVARGQVPPESDARHRRRLQRQSQRAYGENIPENPFNPIMVPLPPLPSVVLRYEEPGDVASIPEEMSVVSTVAGGRPNGTLIWRKRLPQTDALQVNEGSHHVGGVRLTQARFENPPGTRIDQTTYFRQIFDGYIWEREERGHANQEHAFVPIRIFIRGTDYGVRNFEISHKPSGEAGQDNYTTILRWGREFTPIVLAENLTGTILSLYETGDGEAEFLVDITDD